MTKTATYLVTIADPGNITSDADNIRTILTSTDRIQPRERVTVVKLPSVTNEHLDPAERTVIRHDPQLHAEWVRDGWDPMTVAEFKDASPAAVHTVICANVDGPDEHDGRSPWVWLRLANGDLVLGTFPHGDTYFATEEDH